MNIKPHSQSDRNDIAALIATCVLAIACLIASTYNIKILLSLLNQGKRTEAVIVDIKTGARNSKKAVYQFVTDTGKQVTSKDVFQMYITRLHKGEHITVIYDPSRPELVTADIGFMVWQGPVIFLFGFVFFVILGFFIVFYKRRKNQK